MVVQKYLVEASGAKSLHELEGQVFPIGLKDAAENPANHDLEVDALGC